MLLLLSFFSLSYFTTKINIYFTRWYNNKLQKKNLIKYPSKNVGGVFKCSMFLSLDARHQFVVIYRQHRDFSQLFKSSLLLKLEYEVCS